MATAPTHSPGGFRYTPHSANSLWFMILYFGIQIIVSIHSFGLP